MYMFAPKVSIIVPVYNLENYIENTVASLLAQTYQNIEIILIDDGSTDTSLAVIKELAITDDRIVYTTQPNGGAAKARNTGLTLATGEFITFVDGDDMLSPNAIADNIDFFSEDKVDWVAFSIRRVDAKGNYIQTKGVYEDFVIHSYEEISSESFVPYFYSRKLSGVACAAIYRKSSIDSISFTEGKYYEDSIYFIDLLCNTRCAVLSDKGEYLYVDRDNSSQRAALDLPHLDSMLYVHQKRQKMFRHLFPIFEELYNQEETNYFYFLKNEVSKKTEGADVCMRKFNEKKMSSIRFDFKKELKYYIYTILGYKRVKSLLQNLTQQ